jgi:hypothetical protein
MFTGIEGIPDNWANVTPAMFVSPSKDFRSVMGYVFFFVGGRGSHTTVVGDGNWNYENKPSPTLIR